MTMGQKVLSYFSAFRMRQTSLYEFSEFKRFCEFLDRMHERLELKEARRV